MYCTTININYDILRKNLQIKYIRIALDACDNLCKRAIDMQHITKFTQNQTIYALLFVSSSVQDLYAIRRFAYRRRQNLRLKGNGFHRFLKKLCMYARRKTLLTLCRFQFESKRSCTTLRRSWCNTHPLSGSVSLQTIASRRPAEIDAAGLPLR